MKVVLFGASVILLVLSGCLSDDGPAAEGAPEERSPAAGQAANKSAAPPELADDDTRASAMAHFTAHAGRIVAGASASTVTDPFFEDPDLAVNDDGPYPISSDDAEYGLILILEWTPTSLVSERLRLDVGAHGADEGPPPRRFVVLPGTDVATAARVLPAAGSAAVDQPFTLWIGTFDGAGFDAEATPT